ncbi:glycoside hydrolase family 9 protein [Butyrivibrio sp. MC2013]|uniref:glycoside hydrolase family 9 protein n=1 Tax=Butyrivibrio sp. MC2013 TaxID=1280686 RepID=UPI00042097FC|nr:glycoside hydrolase family 9 protein [Butyrivibrio sp. MC2013]
MHFWGRKTIIQTTWAAVMAACVLIGCSKAEGTPTVIAPSQENALPYEDPADKLPVTGAISPVRPRILVDQGGYLTGAEKIAYFIGDDIPRTYEIRRTRDDKHMFTGSISSSSYRGEGEPCLADFTEFQTDGEYYLYAEGMGESCAFTIGDDAYDSLSSEAMHLYYLNRCGVTLSEEYAGEAARSGCHLGGAATEKDPAALLDVTGGWHLDGNADRDVPAGCRVVNNLLLAYEMNKDSFGDDSAIPESGNGLPDILDEAGVEVRWLLKMQDEATGSVHASAITKDTGKVTVTAATNDATVSFAATVAWYGYLYEEYDRGFAEKCKSAAERAYESFLKSGYPADYPASLHAAAQLYRLTADKHYENVLTLYFRTDDYYKKMITDENLFLAGICYLMTNRPVNTQVCSRIMDGFKDETLRIVGQSNMSVWGVGEEDLFDEEMTVREDDRESFEAFYEKLERILDEMRILTVMNHIIYSREYTGVLEDYLHYLLGCNPTGADLAASGGEYSASDLGAPAGVMYDAVYDAKFLILLGAVR